MAQAALHPAHQGQSEAVDAVGDARAAHEVASHFRERVPVIVNIVNLSEAEALRMVDFMVGLTQGLEGKIARVTEKVFLLSPAHVNVSESSDQSAASNEELVGY